MNGLQYLMQGAPRPAGQPQQAGPRPAPAQNDPRMAAAMDVVKNDVPEPLQNLVSENEFAQKAMELLQSAGGQAAMGQPPATPPTVKQRVDQQAMEGVAGLLQRLAPGMQQRGQQVQQAQARKMIGGGMPTMGAPNMARMAMGGIVGYQAGGGVEEQPMMGPPEPNLYQRMGQGLKNYGTNAQESMDILRAAKAGIGVPYGERSAVMKQVRDEIAAQKQNRDPNFIQRMGQKLMNAGLNVEESKSILKKFYNTFGKTYEEMSNGMVMGGGVKRFQAGMEVELDEDLIASLLAQQPEATGYTGPSAEERRAALVDEDAARAQLREARRAEQRTRQELAERGLSGPEINRYLSSRLDAVEPGGIGELKQPQFDTRSPQTGPFPARLIDDTSVGTAEGGRGAPQTNVARTLESITNLQVPSADISSLPRSPLRSSVETAMQQRISADPEQARIAEEDRQRALAQTAYSMSPEMKAEYDRRKAALDEYYTAQLDPKRQRSQKLNALLKGLATPGGIARSGIAALEGTTAVDDARLEARRKQAEEQFGIAKEMGGIERESRAKAFEAARTSGQSAFERASAAVNQAAQSLTQLATSDETRAQGMAVQNYTRQMDALKSQLNVFLQQEKLAEDDKRTAAKLVSDIRRAQSAKDDTILDIQNSMIVYSPEQRTAAERLIQQAQAEKAMLQEDINSLAFKLGLPVNIPAASGASTGSTDLPAGFVPD